MDFLEGSGLSSVVAREWNVTSQRRRREVAFLVSRSGEKVRQLRDLLWLLKGRVEASESVSGEALSRILDDHGGAVLDGMLGDLSRDFRSNAPRELFGYGPSPDWDAAVEARIIRQLLDDRQRPPEDGASVPPGASGRRGGKWVVFDPLDARSIVRDPDRKLARAISRVAGHSDCLDVLDMLGDALQVKSRPIVLSAVKGLSRMVGHPTVNAFLGSVSNRAYDLPVRAAALEALAVHAGQAEIQEAIANFAGDDDPDMRRRVWSIVDALEENAGLSSVAVDFLRDHAFHPNAGVRDEISNRIGEGAVIAHGVSILGDALKGALLPAWLLRGVMLDERLPEARKAGAIGQRVRLLATAGESEDLAMTVKAISAWPGSLPDTVWREIASAVELCGGSELERAITTLATRQSLGRAAWQAMIATVRSPVSSASLRVHLVEQVVAASAGETEREDMLRDLLSDARVGIHARMVIAQHFGLEAPRMPVRKDESVAGQGKVLDLDVERRNARLRLSASRARAPSGRRLVGGSEG